MPLIKFICSAPSLYKALLAFQQRNKTITRIEQNLDDRLILIAGGANFSQTLYVEFKNRDYNLIDVQHRRFDWMAETLKDEQAPVLIEINDKNINITFSF